MAQVATEDAVRALVGEPVFKRGKELLASNKLRDVAFQGELFEKGTAICTGSSPGDSYDLSISIEPDASSKPICRCSCPAGTGGICKHAIALLLQRVKELQKGVSPANGTSSNNSKEGEEGSMDEDMEVSKQVEWVRNPEMLAPNPQGKRTLPPWMTDAPIEKPKRESKARITNKKQKVEEDKNEQPQTSERKTTARRKGNPPKAMLEVAKIDADEVERPRRRRVVSLRAQQNDEVSEGDDEVRRPARNTRRGQKKPSIDDDNDEGRRSNSPKAMQEVAKNDADEVERPRRRVVSSRAQQNDEVSEGDGEVRRPARNAVATRRGQKKPPIDDDNDEGNGGRSKRVAKPLTGNKSNADGDANQEQATRKAPHGRRLLRKHVEDDVSEDNGNDTGGKGLDLTTDDLLSIAQKHLEKEERPKSLITNDLGATDTRKKAKAEGSIFSNNRWKDIGKSSNADGTPSYSQKEQPQIDQDADVPKTTRLVSADTLADDMFGLMFGGAFTKALSPTREKKDGPSKDIAVPMEETTSYAPIQPKPKKKSSLKNHIDTLLN